MDEKAQTALPKGWFESSIGDITLPVQKVDPLDDPGREIEYIDISSIDNVRNIVGEPKHFRLKDAPSRARQIIRTGDVLFATVRPYLRNIAAVPPRYDGQIASTGFSVLRPASGIEPAFLFYKSTSTDFVNALSVEQYGVSYPAVTDDQVREQSILVPPRNEQRRITTKIEELFSELDNAIESLKTAREQLKLYRHAVLKYAFEGKLTAQWREDKQSSLEVATRHLNELASGGATISASEREKLATLPNGWAYVRLGQTIDEPKYGTSKKCDYETKGVGVIRIPNIVSGVIDHSDLKFAQFDADEIQAYGLRRGDILIIRSNGSISIVGKCAVVRPRDEQYLHAGYLIRIRPNKKVVDSDYLHSVLSCHALRIQIEAKAKSTSGVNNINSGELQSLIIPLCSVEEQAALLERLSQALTRFDQLETEIEQQSRMADALRQSILRNAFSGKLVAQDPNDEPASILLERIRSEKNEKINGKKITRRKDAA